MARNFTQSGEAVMGGLASDGTPRHLNINTATRSVQTIPHAESQIYNGNHFMYTDSAELASAATQDYIIATPDTTTWAHMMFEMDGSAITTFQLYEGTTRTGTTDVASGNNNRNDTDTATTIIYKGSSTDGADGTLIHSYKGGAAAQQSRQASGAGHDAMLILKQNTKYLLRFTSGTAANLCNLRLEWFEVAHQT